MSNSHRPPDTTRQCCLCRVYDDVNWVDPTSAFCVGVRPAVAPAVPAPPDTLRRWTHLSGGRADSIHTTKSDTTRRSCLCRVWCAGVNLTIALNVFRLQLSVGDSLELSGIHNLHRRSGHDTDKTVLSCLKWNAVQFSPAAVNPALRLVHSTWIEMDWTGHDSGVNGHIGIHLLRTNRALTVLQTRDHI